MLKLARFQDAADVALGGLGRARQAGLGASWWITFLVANAAEALLAAGRTAEAAALIDPLTAGPPDRDHWLVHEARAEIDMLRGDIHAAAAARQLIDAIDRSHAAPSTLPASLRIGPRSWRSGPGAPATLWPRSSRVLPLLKTPDLTIFCGRLLAAGLRACADLAEHARARRDEPAVGDAGSPPPSLVAWVRPVARRPVHRPSVRRHNPG